MFFTDQCLIVTYRLNHRRTRLEAHVLARLGPVLDDVPQLLGYKDDLLFQSDVGETRLSRAAQNADENGQSDLASKAVSVLFRILSAARETKLVSELPHLGAKPT